MNPCMGDREGVYWDTKDEELTLSPFEPLTLVFHH